MRALITIFTLLIITAISHHHIVNVETLWLVSDGDVKSLMLIPAQDSPVSFTDTSLTHCYNLDVVTDDHNTMLFLLQCQEFQG